MLGAEGLQPAKGRRFAPVILLLASAVSWGQAQRKVIIDQDCMGPAGTDLNAILVLIQSPEVEPLGITVVTGDGWRDEEVAHTLRMLEIIGRTDIPVFPGAAFPLVNSKEGIENWEKQYGKVAYMGAWSQSRPGWTYHDPFVVPELKEGNPTLKAANEDAAHFMVRMAQEYPHQVTIYAAGPLTNLALAMALDPHFPELTKELVVMGGSMNPATDDPEFTHSPQREFNFWFDPEATHKVLHGGWPKITCTTVDISVKTRVTKAMLDEIAQVNTPLARYVSQYTRPGQYMWDELAAAAWVDPSIITREEMVYLDAEVDHGAGYGNTLTWSPGSNPGLGEQLAHVQQDLDTRKLYRLFVQLMTSPIPVARAASLAPAPNRFPGAFNYYDQPEFKAGAVDATANPGGYSAAAAPDSYDLILAYVEGESPPDSLPRAHNRSSPGARVSQAQEPLSKADEIAMQGWNENQLFSRGSELLLHHQFAPALAVFRRGVERFPDSAKLQMGLGVAWYAQGQYDKSITALIHATDLMASDPRPYLLLGKAYRASALESDDVVRRFERLVELQPGNAQARYYYALSLWKGKHPSDLPRVEALLKSAATLDPQFADAHLQLGALYAQQGNFSRAVEQYREAIRTKPDLAAAHYRLAQAYLRTGNKSAAQAELDAYNRLRTSRRETRP